LEQCEKKLDNFEPNLSVQEELNKHDGRDSLLTGKLKQLIAEMSYDVALVGVASIERFSGAPVGHGPRDFIPDANAVVVIGFPITEGLSDFEQFLEKSEVIKEEDTYLSKDGSIKPWKPRQALRNHIERRCSHEIINIELQRLSMYAAILLEKAGYKSVYLPTSYGQTFSWPVNINSDLPHPPQGFGAFSTRHAAVAAGLGEFGLNNLLLTPQYGPRNRFVSLITRAPLVADPLLQKPVCLGKKCSLCLKKCGGKAFGEFYELEIGGHVNHLARLNRDACRASFGSCLKKCITACPVGLKLNQAGR
jgi:epoxyqueuosine reductase QueG